MLDTLLKLAERLVVAFEAIVPELRENNQLLKAGLHFRQQLANDPTAIAPPATDKAKAKTEAKAPAEPESKPAPKVRVAVTPPKPVEPEASAAEDAGEETGDEAEAGEPIDYQLIPEALKNAYARADKADPSGAKRAKVKTDWKNHVASFGVETAKDIPAAKWQGVLDYLNSL